MGSQISGAFRFSTGCVLTLEESRYFNRGHRYRPMALTAAEKQRRYRERLKAKRPIRVIPDFVDDPYFGRVMTLAGAMKDCPPAMRGQLLAEARAQERALEAEAEGEGDEDD
jgi:hypothetical protein